MPTQPEGRVFAESEVYAHPGAQPREERHRRACVMDARRIHDSAMGRGYTAPGAEHGDPDDGHGRDGGLRVLTCRPGLAMKLSAAHQAIGNVGCLQQGALGRKVSRQIPRDGD